MVSAHRWRLAYFNAFWEENQSSDDFDFTEEKHLTFQ
jgi:hypothetical protein